MYSYLFAILYPLIARRNETPRFITAGLVMLAMLIHVGFLHVLLSYYLDFQIFISFSKDSSTNKAIFLPFLIIWWTAVYLYFTKRRIVKIQEKHQKEVNIVNSTLVILIYLIPLTISIMMS